MLKVISFDLTVTKISEIPPAGQENIPHPQFSTYKKGMYQKINLS